MAESNTLVHLNTASQKTQKTCKKFSLSFFHRGFFSILLIAVFTLFPSEAPEFLNESILSASWELIHLFFVGIAISYGIFCRRSAENCTHNEIPSKPESPQSYVSKVLQFSSVFTDDDEVDSSNDVEATDDSKFQTWSSQYQRNSPVVVVADKVSDNSTNKPLLLPVRSLRSSAKDTESFVNYVDEFMSSTEQTKETVVLPSPIPWRSRTDMNNDSEFSEGMVATSSVSNVDTVPMKIPSFRHQNALNIGSESTRSLSLERRAKFSEDMVKKRSFKYSSPPAPPPPPPLPPPIHGYHAIFDKKIVTKSLKDELKDLNMRGRKGLQIHNDYVLDPVTSVTQSRGNLEDSLLGKSVRTLRSKNVQNVETSKNDSLEQSRSSETNMHSRHQNKKINEFFGKIVVSSDDSDSDDDHDHDNSDHVVAETSREEGDASNSAVKAETDENEVDKKADEFIAKFRDQIRLQRIDSIKKSTSQRTVKKQL